MSHHCRLLLMALLMLTLLPVFRAAADEAVNVPISALRAQENYKEEVERIQADALRRLKLARERALQQLESVLQSEKKRGNDESARAIQAMIDQIDGQITAPDLADKPGDEESVYDDKAKDEKGDKDDKDAQAPRKVTLWACGQDDIEIRVNGEFVLRVDRASVGSAAVELKPGDIITVFSKGRQDINSLWLVAGDSDASKLYFQPGDKWKAYIPPNPDAWWELRGKKVRTQSVIPAKDNLEYVDQVKNTIAKRFPSLKSPTLIHAPLSAEKYQTYLAYTVRKSDLDDAPKAGDAKPEKK
jgi:hypothetical protein